MESRLFSENIHLTATPKMETGINAECLLSLQDDELLLQLKEVEDLINYFNGLLEVVYAEVELTPEREVLHEETSRMKHGMGPSSSETEEPDPNRLTDIRLKLILKLRIALRRAFQESQTRETTVNQIVSIADGDLAHTTYYYVGGQGDIPIILGRTDNMKYVDQLRFSPELQRQIARTDVYSSIALDLASNPHLTEEAKQLLLTHEDQRVRDRMQRLTRKRK